MKKISKTKNTKVQKHIFKREITLPRLYAESIDRDGNGFEVTIYNSGSSACNNAKCILYTKPRVLMPGLISNFHLTDTQTFYIGAKERVIVKIGHSSGNIYDLLYTTYLAVVYDPVS